MGVRNIPPHAGAMVESLRGLGYNPSTALADLIDNSIAACATEVDVWFEWQGPQSWIRIVDNGVGMDDATLEEGMRLGAADPRAKRAATDLGRFGLGLKTASFSQARRLTVASRRDGGPIVCLRWDLNLLDQPRSEASWPLFEGPAPGSEELLAPLDTMMTSRPSRTKALSWRHHSPMACSSKPRPSLVTKLEPTLTTMRRASRNTVELEGVIAAYSGVGSAKRGSTYSGGCSETCCALMCL